MVPLALGTQTGGSVIRPAAYNGAFAIKPSFGSINYGQGYLTSSYEGMNATLRKRLSHNVIFNVAYTFGHAISVADSFDFSPMDSWNQKLDKGSTGTPQRLTASFIYSVPYLTSIPKAAQYVTNGWQMSGVFIFDDCQHQTCRQQCNHTGDDRSVRF